MSAKHALLGLLLEQPAYPYQLADRLKQRLGPAWEVNSGQLYQTIKALERDGLIERAEGEEPEREDRHVFQVTEEGEREFERFFRQGPETVRLSRRPLLVKLTLAGPRKLEQALAKIDAYEQGCAKRLAEVARLREQLPREGPLVRADHLLLRLNLSADVVQLEGELRWARHAREMLSWLASRDAVWPAERERAGARRQLFGRIAGASADAGEDDGRAKRTNSDESGERGR